MNDQPSAPGWDAITAAFASVYGDQEPRHWGTIIPASLGGRDPLQGISAYRSQKGGMPHWHLVTYGFTELWQKECEDASISGYGFELTMRLACDENEDAPPMWALNFLQNMARYVFQSGRIFAIGDHINCNGPIALSNSTKICAICCVEDQELPNSISTPNGTFSFVQIYGITLKELDEVIAWNTRSFTELLRTRDPLLVTSLGRDDFYGDRALLAAVREGSASEPSSTSMLYVTPLGVTESATTPTSRRIKIGAISVPSLKRLVDKRLGFSLDLQLIATQAKVLLIPEENANSYSDSYIALNSSERQTLNDSLQSKAGVYSLSPRLEIEVVRSEIKDQDGKIVSIIG